LKGAEILLEANQMMFGPEKGDEEFFSFVPDVDNIFAS
jgi:hypothetical protein